MFAIVTPMKRPILVLCLDHTAVSHIIGGEPIAINTAPMNPNMGFDVLLMFAATQEQGLKILTEKMLPENVQFIMHPAPATVEEEPLAPTPASTAGQDDTVGQAAFMPPNEFVLANVAINYALEMLTDKSVVKQHAMTKLTFHEVIAVAMANMAGMFPNMPAYVTARCYALLGTMAQVVIGRMARNQTNADFAKVMQEATSKNTFLKNLQTVAANVEAMSMDLASVAVPADYDPENPAK
jgi:hypothetical protein